ncbi:hypothetical protein F8S13_13135 [Chloroflexia bacterium SDU3-3]|nr:hypothetical protein F8S13_13135 [Chloroflexia bacterium SDU3-3]
MTTASQIALTNTLVKQIGRYLEGELLQSNADAAALCTLDGQVVWASDAAFERAAPNIARIGISSLRLWAKTRTGRLDQVGLVTADGVIDLVFVGPLASLLVVSSAPGRTGWPEGEPALMLQALGIAG